MNEEHPFDRPVLTRKDTDWTLCCFCQDKNNIKDLRCPFKIEHYHKAYNTIEVDLKSFVVNALPLPLGVTLECLDDGSGIANTLLKNEAKYHNGCRGSFRSHVVQRNLGKRAKENCQSKDFTLSQKRTRSSFNTSIDRKSLQCVCCEKFQGENDEQMFTARSENCGKNLYKWSIESENWVVHSRLNSAINAEDAAAGDVHYHASCYTKLKNDARAANSRKENTDKCSFNLHTYDPLVIAQLAAFVQSKQSAFKLADLRKLYDQRLEQLGSEWVGMYVHQTRFKEHLVEKLGPDWSEYSEGRDIYISHQKTVGAALAETANRLVTEDEAKKIVEVGLLLRRYVLEPQMPFNGSFNASCLSEPVAKPLLSLLDILLQGSSSIAEHEDHEISSAKIRVACTISQLICNNAAKQTSQAINLYQRKERETPFPLYVGLKLHANDRQKSTINVFHSLGISVSYDRIMNVRKSLALAVSNQFAEDGVVVPSNIKRGVFTTGGVDNIDESGRVELHGTAITLTNHTTHDNMGINRPHLTMDAPVGATVNLPAEFAIVPYIDEHAGEIVLSSIPDGTARPAFAENLRTMEHDIAWLSHVHKVLIEQDCNLEETPVTYSGFLSHKQCIDDIKPRATIGVFPVFYEKASTMSMQKHAMLVVKRAIEFVNPGQVAVIEGDCPLYAQQKKCQWGYPDEVGESKMVCFMGMLHVEMASQDCGGKILAGSGWDRIFSMANIFTSGIASSLLAGKHVKRTRYAYQLTLAWLHVPKE